MASGKFPRDDEWWRGARLELMLLVNILTWRISKFFFCLYFIINCFIVHLEICFKSCIYFYFHHLFNFLGIKWFHIKSSVCHRIWLEYMHLWVVGPVLKSKPNISFNWRVLFYWQFAIVGLYPSLYHLRSWV